MAPNFRQNTQTRRGNRSGYVEHDDFEGLPVRQWRPEVVTIMPLPPPDPTRRNDIWAVELPHGMPKDSHLLPSHSQDLLRASRSGRFYKRPAPTEEEEPEADPTVAEKAEKKEEDLSTKSFKIKLWKQVPRNAEEPTVSYLAKRRKGTVTLSSSLPAGAAPGPTITKATVRRIDAAGTPYHQEVTLSEGQPVDGVIISTTVVAAPIAGIAADASVTPVRRRPPPPKRKPKGPGRGRKKKLPLPANSHTSAAHPAAPGHASTVPAGGTQHSKPEDNESKQNDVEMADDDEGDDGDNGDDDGEDGDEDDEEGDGADGETGFVSRADSEVKSDQAGFTPSQNEAGETTGTTPLPPTLELSPASTSLFAPPPAPSHIEGSPLKQVVSAQSPGDPGPDSALQGESAKPLATTDSVEQTLNPAGSVPDGPQAMGRNLPLETSSGGSMPTADTDSKDDGDVEMQDAAPIVTDAPTENVASASGDSLTATTDVQNASLTQSSGPSDPNPITLPVDGETQGQVPDLNLSPKAEISEAGLTPSGEIRTSGNATEATISGDSLAEDNRDPATETPAVQTAAGSFTNERSDPALGSTESQDNPPMSQKQDENAANSPDLFSGLEAALNQHGHASSSESVPEKFEAEASRPEAVSHSE